MKRTLTAAPPAPPTTGMAWATAFCVTVTPKRLATSAIKRATAGAPALTPPLAAKCFEASAMALARTARTVK